MLEIAVFEDIKGLGDKMKATQATFISLLSLTKLQAQESDKIKQNRLELIYRFKNFC